MQFTYSLKFSTAQALINNVLQTKNNWKYLSICDYYYDLYKRKFDTAYNNYCDYNDYIIITQFTY